MYYADYLFKKRWMDKEVKYFSNWYSLEQMKVQQLAEKAYCCMEQAKKKLIIDSQTKKLFYLQDTSSNGYLRDSLLGIEEIAIFMFGTLIIFKCKLLELGCTQFYVTTTSDFVLVIDKSSLNVQLLKINVPYKYVEYSLHNKTVSFLEHNKFCNTLNNDNI